MHGIMTGSRIGRCVERHALRAFEQSGWNRQIYFQNGPMPQTYSNFNGPNGGASKLRNAVLSADGPVLHQLQLTTLRGYRKWTSHLID